MKQTYEEFVNKFKPKKTTDDCYTPPEIYAAVVKYVESEYKLDRVSFIRPFYPGGDYENYSYNEGDVVVDNPPFSIFSKIIKFYQARGIPFFLFCPALTSLSSVAKTKGVTLICVGCPIVYENGAKVRTYFATNLEPKNKVRIDPRLTAMLKVEKGKELPHYNYPPEILTVKDILAFSAHDVPYVLKADEGVYISNIDSLREKKKGLFSGGILLSPEAVMKKPNTHVREDAPFLELSEREKKTQMTLENKYNTKKNGEENEE